MIFRSIRKVLVNNIKLLKELNTFDRSRIFMTSIYWICDQIEIIIYNIFLLPFLYYAVDNSMQIDIFFLIDGILLLILVLCDCYQTFYNTKYVEESNQKISHNSNKKVFAHIKNADLAELYDPGCIDMTMRILNMGPYTITSAFDMQWWAISVVLLGVCYVSVLIKIDALLIIAAVLSAVAMFFINLKFNKLNYQNIVEKQKISRKLQYVVDGFSLAEYSQDLQTTDLKSVLKKRLHHVTLATYERLTKITKKMCKYTYIKNIIVFIVTTSITWAYLAIKYLLTDSFVLGITEIIVAETMMQQLCNLLINISTIGPTLQENSMYAEEYFQYLEREADIKTNEEGEEPVAKANGISLKNVSFSYDGRNAVLKNISIDIEGGEKIAIVGRNGEGKSTIVKLLLRLYKPQSGEIYMDGKPAEAYALKAYRERFGVAFQQTQIYAVSVLENVLMKPCEAGEEQAKEIVENALKRSKLYERIKEEERGVEATLTKEFDQDGIELSGGQAQKLALARVFARNCGIVVLDEPSAALDPISEAEMYESMLEAMTDRTVILVSHRLSACRNVDRIYVIENGRVAEQGSHNELLQREGLYAQMWNLQASGYMNE